MKDWTDAFKEKLDDDGIRSPENGLEALQGKIASSRRRRSIGWTSFAAAAAAASLAAILMLPPSGTCPEEPSRTINPTAETILEPSAQEQSSTVGNVPVKAPVTIVQKPRKILAEAVGNNDTGNTAPESPAEGYDAIPTDNGNQEKTVETEAGQTDGRTPSRPGNPSGINGNTFEDFYFNQEDGRRKERHLKVRLSSGQGLSGNIIQSGLPIRISNSDAFSLHDVETDNPQFNHDYKTYSHRHPVTFGISLNYGLSDRLSLTSGLDYSLCFSSLKGMTASGNTQTQRASYLGLPLRLDWSALQGKSFFLYFGAGGEAWKCLGAWLEDRKLKDNNIYLSAIGLAGLRYEPINGMGVFVEPQFSHTFLPADRKEGSYVPSALSESPDNLSVRIGLSFSIK